jgi:hypothetical protein
VQIGSGDPRMRAGSPRGVKERLKYPDQATLNNLCNRVPKTGVLPGEKREVKF